MTRRRITRMTVAVATSAALLSASLATPAHAKFDLEAGYHDPVDVALGSALLPFFGSSMIIASLTKELGL